MTSSFGSKAVIAALLLTAAVATAEPAWTLRNPGLSNTPFSQILWDGKQYLALGSNRVTATSSDAHSWTAHTSPFTYFQQAASSGTITVVSDTGIMTSSDGLNWDAASLPQDWCCFSSIFWTGQRFLLNGVFNGVDSIAISDDGKHWSLVSLGGSTNGRPQYFATSPQAIVMAGSGGIFYSGNQGLQWTHCSTSVASVGVVRLDTQFISATETGDVQTSSDGLHWTTRADLVDQMSNLSQESSPQWSEVGNLNGAVYLIGKQSFLSRDLATWTLDSVFLPWWVMGRSSLPTRIQNTLPVNGNLFLLGAGGSIWNSTNGTDWTLRSSTLTHQHLRSVAAGGGNWVAVGDSGAIVRSEDGANWSLVKSAALANLTKVIWTGSGFQVLGDSGIVLSSPDGTNWARRSIGSFVRLLDLVWSDSLMVAIGDSNRIFRSTDGASWTGEILPSSGLIRYLASSAKGFVIVDGQDGAFSSVDAVTWAYNGGYSGFQSADALVWSGRSFLAYGHDKLHTSEDGKIWTVAPAQVSGKGFTQILPQGSSLIAVASDGSTSSLVGDSLVVPIGSATGFILSMAVSDSLWVQVGANGTIFSARAPASAAVEKPVKPRGIQIARMLGTNLVLHLEVPGEIQIEVINLNGVRKRIGGSRHLPVGNHYVSLESDTEARFVRVRIGNDGWQTIKVLKFR